MVGYTSFNLFKQYGNYPYNQLDVEIYTLLIQRTLEWLMFHSIFLYAQQNTAHAMVV